ncbi:substrate-binding periplasmic protein [Kiloniella sp. b19]|uniref:substrate-binding periplasmic protein n=1 Tax=Kiloniella sp. GXU_MW_B19 TaxID=3141326 RepID=UPI0031CE2229
MQLCFSGGSRAKGLTGFLLCGFLSFSFVGVDRSLKAEETGQSIEIQGVEFPPYALYNSETGEYSGLDVEIVREAFAAVGIDVSYAFMPWARAFKNVAEGRALALVTCLYNRERLELFRYSNAVSTADFSFVGLGSHLKPEDFSLGEAEDYKIGVGKGYASTRILEKRGFPKLDYSSDDLSLIRKLINKRVDLLYGNSVAFRYQLAPFVEAGEVWDSTEQEHNQYLCISRKHPRSEYYLDKFNEGLVLIKAQGVHQEIAKKYTSFQ